jgi:hypothetical protein
MHGTNCKKKKKLPGVFPRKTAACFRAGSHFHSLYILVPQPCDHTYRNLRDLVLPSFFLLFADFAGQVGPPLFPATVNTCYARVFWVWLSQFPVLYALLGDLLWHWNCLTWYRQSQSGPTYCIISSVSGAITLLTWSLLTVNLLRQKCESIFLSNASKFLKKH